MRRASMFGIALGVSIDDRFGWRTGPTETPAPRSR